MTHHPPPSPSSSQIMSDTETSSIQVVVRLRPMNDVEKKTGTLPVVTASTQNKTVTVVKGHGSRQTKSSYAFDNVFTSFSTQEEVFDATVKPVLLDVMKGYESTVFAYGQTGTGKTHTMEGSLSDPEMHGVIPRSAQAIFDLLDHPKFIEYTVMCSYLEIYNEDLCDLLADHSNHAGGSGQPATKLEIREGKHGTFCRGLSQSQVHSAEDVLALMQKAELQRKIAETKMNEHSSRSHCIFTMRINAKASINDGQGLMEINGKLHMVDLAGSECAKTASLDSTSRADKALERERRNINTSLLTLGRVISMLKEQSESKKPNKNIRIPYRDSKLTRILQESLGGRCKTVLVATLSPSVTAIEESVSTLNYAQAANGIVNKPIAASYLSLSVKGGTPRGNGGGGDSTGDDRNSVEYWHEMECRLLYMQAQVEEAQGALARKHVLQTEATEHAEKLEAELTAKEETYAEANRQVKSLTDALQVETENRVSVEKKHHDATLQIESLRDDLARETKEKASLAKKLNDATTQIQNLKGELDRETEARIAVERALQEMTEKANSLKKKWDREVMKRREVEAQLRETVITLQKTAAVLQATQKTEHRLKAEATKLLNTLKESITDGDSLHSVVLEQRQTEVERRRATRDFNEASIAVLEKTIASLSDLAVKLTAHKSLVVKSMEDMSDQEEKAINETSDLMKEISKNVACLTSTMKTQLTDHGGILPIVSETASSVEGGIKNALNIAIEGEDTLTRTTQSARERLEEYANYLDELRKTHETSSAECLLAVESNISTSKKKIGDMVSSAVEVLNAARNERITMRSAHNELLSQWKEQSIDASNRVLTVSTDQKNVVGETVNVFEEEMGHLDSIDEALEDQQAYLREKESAHYENVAEQTSILGSQLDMFQSMHERQEELRESVVRTIMAGVRGLVSKQMAVLASEQENQYQSMKKSNTDLGTINDLLGVSTKKIISATEVTNASLVKEAEGARRNDVHAKHVMEQTKDTLAEIAKESEAHQILTSTFAEDAVDSVAEMENHETLTDRIVNEITKDGNSCTDHLAETVLKDTNKGISSVTKVGELISSYSADVIVANSSAALDELERPRKNVVDTFSQHLQEVSDSIVSGRTAVEKAVANQCDTADKLFTSVESKENYYSNDYAYRRREDLLANKTNLVQAATEFTNVTGAELSDTSTQTANLKANVGDFAAVTMHAGEDVADAPKRNMFVYSEVFSSTPSMDEILRGGRFDSDVFDENKDDEVQKNVGKPIEVSRSEGDLRHSASASVASDTTDVLYDQQ